MFDPTDAPACAGATAGILLGIARKGFKYAPMEQVRSAWITPERGVEGDYRGIFRPGQRNRRQVTVFTRDDWDAALAAIGAEAGWPARRCNLFVDGIALPRVVGARLRIGDALLEVTGECTPCKRMEDVSKGLFPALAPDWRGGRTLRVIAAGEAREGDQVSVEE